MKDKDGAVLVEVASTTKQATWTGDDIMKIRKEVKVKHDKKRELVNGKGTMVMLKKEIES